MVNYSSPCDPLIVNPLIQTHTTARETLTLCGEWFLLVLNLKVTSDVFGKFSKIQIGQFWDIWTWFSAKIFFQWWFALWQLKHGFFWLWFSDYRNTQKKHNPTLKASILQMQISLNPFRLLTFLKLNTCIYLCRIKSWLQCQNFVFLLYLAVSYGFILQLYSLLFGWVFWKQKC